MPASTVGQTMIGQLVSRYRILEPLGKGGMGTVYLAEDTQLGRQVAVKFPHVTADNHDARARFLREARAASELSHAGIATIFDYGETSDGQPFLVMELVRGRPLGDVARAGGLTLERILDVVSEIAAALGEAHAHGVVHRDVKPSNVMIDDSGRVRLLDFGLAKYLPSSATPDAETLPGAETQRGVVLGTAAYLSPEQARGGTVDGRSDLFALGIVLYELVTGLTPFRGESFIEVATSILHLEPAPPSRINPLVPPDLDRLVVKALAKPPEKRYQSAQEFIDDAGRVRTVLGQEASRSAIGRTMARTGATAGSTLSSVSQILRRSRVPVVHILIGITLIILAGSAVWWWVRPRPYQPSVDAQRWLGLGTAALRDGAYYQASKALAQAVAADDGYALAHARLAEALMALDQVDQAKDELLRATAVSRSKLLEIDALYLDAIAATARRDFTRAVGDYRDIVNRTPDAEKPRVLVDLGSAEERDRDLKGALGHFMDAARRDPQYATAFLRAGVVYGEQQDLSGALAAFEKAAALYEALGNVEGRAEVAYQRGALLNQMNRMAEARTALDEALTLAKAANNPSQEIKTKLQLTSVMFDTGDTAHAITYGSEAVRLAEQHNMANLAVQGLNDVGNAQFIRGNFGEAEKYFTRAIELSLRNKARRSEARARVSLASLRVAQSNPAAALPLLEPALAFYEAGGYRSETFLSLALLARAQGQRGDDVAALKAGEHILQLAQAAADQSQVALAHTEIGLVLSRQEKYTEALDHFSQASPIQQQLGVQRTIGSGLVDRARVLWQLGRYREAEPLVARAAAIANAPSGGYKRLSADAKIVDAEMKLSQGRVAEAQAGAERLLAGGGAEFSDIAIAAKLVIAGAKASQRAPAAATRLGREAVDMATRLKNPSWLRRSQLVLAEVMILSGESGGALPLALEAQGSFAKSGGHASEWRAWLMAALASKQAGDREKALEYAQHATAVLKVLEAQWGAENYRTYLARPDIDRLRRQLEDVK